MEYVKKSFLDQEYTVLLFGGKFPRFICRDDPEKESDNWAINIEVFEAYIDSDGEINETEKILNCYIKGDGSFHVWFGNDHGYLALSQKQSMYDFSDLIQEVYEYASTRLSFNEYTIEYLKLNRTGYGNQ